MIPALGLLGAAAFSPQDAVRIGGLALGVIGLTACGIVRDRGRRLQPALWESWGGSPTTRRLRWRDTPDSRTVARLHERVEAALGQRLPTEDEEERDPADADRRYEEAVSALRERTRDKGRFPLVFEENMEYGFRRNSLGLRSIGGVVAATALIASITLLIVDAGGAASRFGRWGTSAALALALLIFWWRAATPDWVRRAAEIYADRLFEAVHNLSRVSPRRSSPSS